MHLRPMLARVRSPQTHGHPQGLAFWCRPPPRTTAPAKLTAPARIAPLNRRTLSGRAGLGEPAVGPKRELNPISAEAPASTIALAVCATARRLP